MRPASRVQLPNLGINNIGAVIIRIGSEIFYVMLLEHPQ